MAIIIFIYSKNKFWDLPLFLNLLMHLEIALEFSLSILDTGTQM